MKMKAKSVRTLHRYNSGQSLVLFNQVPLIKAISTLY